MKAAENNFSTNFFENFSLKATKATGSTTGFVIAFLSIVSWIFAGSFFNYSQSWYLVLTSTPTIITFLMVFLIQKSQNKDSLAIQLKLNELVAAHEFASNRLVNVENMTEEELKVLKKYYSKLSDFSKQEENLHQSHSIDETHELHEIKKEMEDELDSKSKKSEAEQ